MATLQVDENVALYYEDVGQGRPIVFVHGFSMTHAVWENQVARLCGNFRCITLDLRGHGASDKPDSGYSIERNARDVYALLDALNIERPVFVGWSLGVAIGIQMVALFDNMFDKLVLVGGTPCWGQLPDFEFAHPQEEVSQWVEEVLGDRPAWTQGFVRKIFHQEPDPGLSQWLFQQSMQIPLHAILKTVEDSRSADLRGAVSKINVPTLILHGKYDAFDYLEAAQFMAATIADARLHVFESSGHAPFFEEREAFNAALNEFLEI